MKSHPVENSAPEKYSQHLFPIVPNVSQPSHSDVLKKQRIFNQRGVMLIILWQISIYCACSVFSLSGPGLNTFKDMSLPCFPPMNLTHEIINDKGVDHLFIVGLENLNTNTLICVVI